MLTCREYLAQTTQLRHQAAQLVLRSYEGLRIPTNALRMSEDNQLGVYCVVGKVASFKPVSMVYRGDGYSLVQSASQSQDVPSCGRGTRSSSPPVSSPADRSCSSSRPADTIGQ